MPLWIAAGRPMAAAELRAAVAFALRNPDVASLPPGDRKLLDDLAGGFGPETAGSGNGAEVLTTSGSLFGFTLVSAARSGSTGGWTLGWAMDSYRATIMGTVRSVSFALGREHLGWGPGTQGGLLFSDAAGGFDQVEVSFQWRRTYIRKVIGWLDGGRSLIATRVDIPYRPNVRFGFSEAVVMEGAPYPLFALVPVPVFLTPYLQQQLRAPSGFDDNYLMALDAEWLPRPGLRLYGELLIDDFTVATPTANFPSRWGLTAGFHRVSPGDGAEWRVQYTIVPNWTYSTAKPGMHYLLRGFPIGHPLGADFDVLHIRWTQPTHPSPSSIWISYIRKGEGEVGRIWTDETEAWQHVFLRGVVEYSLIAGIEIPMTMDGGWTGTIGPWLAFRTNADHVQDATRLDAGVSINISQNY